MSTAQRRSGAVFMVASVLIYIGIGLVTFGVTFGVVGTRQTLFKPNYRLWLILGGVFVVLGLGTDKLAILVLGIVLIAAAVFKRGEWDRV
ncbi:MAG: hypothetical protein HOB82_01200 [Alphaproteobacteria bacterium]|nr:hypothetical protein [Alphaproteobacteria bacterium]